MQCLITRTVIQDLLSIRVSTQGMAYPMTGLLNPQLAGKLLAQTFKMRKHLALHLLAKLRENSKAILKTYKLFV